MRNYFCIFLFLVSHYNISLMAQNIADEDPTWRIDSAKIHQKIDYIYMNLDKSKLTTGYLLDRIPLSILNIAFFDGKTDSIITSAMWSQLFFELKHFAEFKPTNLPDYKILEKRIDSIKAFNIVPLGIINTDYNHLTEDAYSSGMITVQNEQLFENFSSPDSPYGIKRFFAVAKLGTLKVQKSISFLVDSSFYFTNSNGNIIKFEINFGDGAGFRTVHFGDLVNIIYPDTGNIIIHTKAVYYNDTLHCKSEARVIGTASYQNKTIPPALGVCSVFKENTAERFYFPPDDFFYLSGGRGYVKYGCENTSGEMRKPFIFVEGIDFNAKAPAQDGGDDDYGTRYGDLGWKQIILATQFNNEPDPFSDGYEVPDPNIEKVPILMNKLCSDGYDLIMLDFADGATGIDQNAMVLVELIQKVNQQLIGNGSKHQIVVMGVSMGGQVSRYALRYMELNGMEHNTRMFISFDSPNSGANIPLGTQFAIRYATLWMPKFAMPQIFRQATKQLLRYHYMPTLINNNDYPYPYDEHTYLYTVDPNMTIFPQKTYNVAIANGSGFGLTQGYAPGAQTVDVNAGRKFEVWAVPHLGNGYTIFKGTYVTVGVIIAIVAILSWIPLVGWFLAAIATIVYIVTTDVNNIKNTFPYDNTSGGYRSTNQDLVNGLISAWGGNVFNYSAIHKNHSFIPTYSAFGLPSTISNVTSNLNAYYNNAQGTSNQNYPFYNPYATPFDVIYAPSNNQQHVNITDDNIQWIMNEVSPPNLFLQNKTVYKNSMNGWTYDARNNITIGYDVDNSTYGGITGRQQAGPFIIDGLPNGATVDIHAGNEIHLVGGPGSNGVWFKKGSNVHLCVKPYSCEAVCRMANTGNGRETEKHENALASGSGNWNNFVYREVIKTEHNSSTENIFSKSIFPNPFSDHLHIDYIVQKEGEVYISVYNFTGQKMAELVSTNQHQAGRHSATLDARKFSSGIYYIRIFSNGESETIKVVKMK